MIREITEIHFQETTHQYFHEKGNELISVTTAFEKIGITDFSKVPFHIIEPARVRGDLVHEMAMYYGLGILDESSVDPALGGYLEGIKKFFADEVREIISIEQPVYSLPHGFAGTPDIVYVHKKNWKMLDDYKSSLKPHKANKWQTAAYAYAFEKLQKEKIDHRRGIHFTPDGDYGVDEHANPLRRDFDDFLTILKAAILKINNKIK